MCLNIKPSSVYRFSKHHAVPPQTHITSHPPTTLPLGLSLTLSLPITLPRPLLLCLQPRHSLDQNASLYEDLAIFLSMEMAAKRVLFRYFFAFDSVSCCAVALTF